jgi:hypothetical protein
MNIISGILRRELLTKNDKCNVLWTSTNNFLFEKTLKETNHNFITFDQIYLGQNEPHIIICNNRILYQKKCFNVAMQYHIPVIRIDHEPKPQSVSHADTDDQQYKFPISYDIAIDIDVAESWGHNYNKIITQQELKDLNFWNNTIYKTSKAIFKYNE